MSDYNKIELLSIVSSIITILMLFFTIFSTIDGIFNIIEYILWISSSILCLFIIFFIRNKNLSLNDKSVIIISIVLIATFFSVAGFATNYYQDYSIIIDYNGSYDMGYGADFTHDDISTSGFKEFKLNQSSYVNVGAKKSDGSNKELIISIMRGNRVVETKSTKEPYGEVIINFKE